MHQRLLHMRSQLIFQMRITTCAFQIIYSTCFNLNQMVNSFLCVVYPWVGHQPLEYLQNSFDKYQVLCAIHIEFSRQIGLLNNIMPTWFLIIFLRFWMIYQVQVLVHIVLIYWLHACQKCLHDQLCYITSINVNCVRAKKSNTLDSLLTQKNIHLNCLRNNTKSLCKNQLHY